LAVDAAGSPPRLNRSAAQREGSTETRRDIQVAQIRHPWVVSTPMRVILLATLAVAGLLTSTAQAMRPDFKMSPHRANFGKVTLGATVTTTFTLQNRSAIPASINGWNMGALNPNIGWKQDGAVGGSCIDLALARLPLRPRDTCRAEVALEPAGVGRFGVRFCIQASVDPHSSMYPCSTFHAKITASPGSALRPSLQG
jgi:hypothetical protein